MFIKYPTCERPSRLHKPRAKFEFSSAGILAENDFSTRSAIALHGPSYAYRALKFLTSLTWPRNRVMIFPKQFLCSFRLETDNSLSTAFLLHLWTHRSRFWLFPLLYIHLASLGRFDIPPRYSPLHGPHWPEICISSSVDMYLKTPLDGPRLPTIENCAFACVFFFARLLRRSLGAALCGY